MTRKAAFGLLVVFSGCSGVLKRTAVDQTADVLADGSRAFDRETDAELAEAAIPASLKTMESFLEAHPTQPILLRLLAEGFANYAFGFIEDRAEQVQEQDPDQAAHLRTRALGFYLRSRSFGLRLLALEHEELAQALEKREMPSEELLAEVEQDGLPGLFWTANAWAAAINAGKDHPELLAELPIARALMERAAAIDPGFFHAGPMMALGALEAGLPKALGGKPDIAKAHFEKAQQLTGGSFLMIPVLFAKTAVVQLGDRALFEKTLQAVIDADPDADPDARLGNRLAQRRARRYLAAVDDLFLASE